MWHSKSNSLNRSIEKLKKVPVLRAVSRKLLATYYRSGWFLSARFRRKSALRHREAFAETLATWKPEHQLPLVAVRWLITEVCPYSCSYCDQHHKLVKRNGISNHSFGNYAVGEWLDAFNRHFSANRLTLTITGGETMADRKSITALLNGLSAMATVECIRIDSNAYWAPEWFKDLDRSKLIFNCSFHPEQTSEEEYFNRIHRIVEAGFRIGMVNYVFFGHRIDRFCDYQARLRKLGIPLNPNPNFHTYPTNEEKEFLMRKMPALDFEHKALRVRTNGRSCLYPSLAYEMDYTGRISVACFNSVSGSFFDSKLPSLPEGPVRCPHQSCYCREKYVMLEGYDPKSAAAINSLQYYSGELMEFQRDH